MPGSGMPISSLQDSERNFPVTCDSLHDSHGTFIYFNICLLLILPRDKLVHSLCQPFPLLNVELATVRQSQPIPLSHALKRGASLSCQYLTFPFSNLPLVDSIISYHLDMSLNYWISPSAAFIDHSPEVQPHMENSPSAHYITIQLI